MKKTITLTKMLTLAILLVTFATASASFGGDEKCKTKCCKDQKEKELTAVIAELEKAMTELKAVAATMMTTEVKQSLVKMKAIAVARPMQVFAFASLAETFEAENESEAKFRINFTDISKEMDNEQAKMTTSPDAGQKIDFSNLEKEMDNVQKEMSRRDEVKS